MLRVRLGWDHVYTVYSTYNHIYDHKIIPHSWIAMHSFEKSIFYLCSLISSTALEYCFLSAPTTIACFSSMASLRPQGCCSAQSDISEGALSWLTPRCCSCCWWRWYGWRTIAWCCRWHTERSKLWRSLQPSAMCSSSCLRSCCCSHRSAARHTGALLKLCFAISGCRYPLNLSRA